MRKFPLSRNECHLWLNPTRLHSPHQTESKYFALTYPDSQICICWKSATLFPTIFVQGISELQYCASSGKALRRSERGLGLRFRKAARGGEAAAVSAGCTGCPSTAGAGTAAPTAQARSRERNGKETSFSGTPLWWQTLSSIAKDTPSAFIGKQPLNPNLV